ncbi:hypothetical protein KVR01_007603 [Diaporthe batatas]|uniref:uncharacterized protein n=1 Tax=Diaporthe batatas TaxID=748121 RepID=UPI001D040C10|nr:uncharacterized protein KVR01_007603 [Diaporthe batatas]KAG8163125.1 hypothetical protein KVR01_007603 [Diaporthe batatas]
MPKTPENRDATVVYPGTSPELMMAYRIFGPGYNDLDALAEQKRAIVTPSCDLTGEGGGGGELTRLGQDLAASMDLDINQIMYSPDSQEPSPKRQKTLEERLEIYLTTPDLWVGRDAALARTRTHVAALDEMHATIGTFLEIYTTRLPYAKPLGQAMDRLIFNFMRWRDDAARIERLIELHDNSRPWAMWVSPETPGVTHGPRVAQALFMFWELDRIIVGMRRALAHCVHLRDKLLAARATDLRKRHYHELVFNLRRFASMCIIEELRGEFVDELEAERRQWSPESSPCSEEYATDFEDFSSDSESEGEEGEDGEGEEDNEAAPATDAAAPTQE